MILTDGTYVVSDRCIGELFAFGNRAGLRMEWFQWKRIPHYDILGGRVAARVAGDPEVELVDSRELVRRSVRWPG